MVGQCIEHRTWSSLFYELESSSAFLWRTYSYCHGDLQASKALEDGVEEGSWLIPGLECPQ